jgi:molybdenum cofactor sulfurtransferase
MKTLKSHHSKASINYVEYEKSPAPRLLPKPSFKTLKSHHSRASINYMEYEESPASSQHTLANEQHALAYAPAQLDFAGHDDETKLAYASFLKAFPEYQLTWILDTLRRSDFFRLDRTGETYADYMGGSLYPESLLRVHTDFLSRSVLGNTHSVSNRYACL